MENTGAEEIGDRETARKAFTRTEAVGWGGEEGGEEGLGRRIRSTYTNGT